MGRWDLKFLFQDAVVVLVSLVADPVAWSLGNTCGEWGSEMWKRRELKRREFPCAQPGAQPTEDLWESVGSFSRACRSVFQQRGQKDGNLSTICQSVVGGGLLLRAIILPYLPRAALWREQRP